MDINGSRRPPARTRLRLIVAGLLTAVSIPAMAATTNLITNGNFAVTGPGGTGTTPTTSFQFGTYNNYTPPGTVTGWSGPGYNFVFLPGSTAATSTYGVGDLSLYTNPVNPISSSLNYLAADSDYGTTPITQTVNGLIAGHTYALSFAWAGAQQTGFTGATIDTWTVSLGSQSYTTPTINVADHGFTGWLNQTYLFTADSTSETLSFLAAGSPQVPPFALLANVTMFDVPEPGTLAIMASALVGVTGLARWRRRTRATIPVAT